MKLHSFALALRSLLGIAATMVTTAGAAHADEQQRFVQYTDAWKVPNVIFNNKRALDVRLELLDFAPKGSKVKIMTFVFENGESTRQLAAHMCRAARRGVDIQFMADSKMGSIPGAPNIFDRPLTEEIYQYLANCGVHVRVHNHLPDFKVIAGKVVPSGQYIIKFRNRPEDETSGAKETIVNAQIPVNRLNHRKLFWVQSPAGRTCFLLGGRNLGDHYLAWHEDSFIDSDVVYCDHHQKALVNAGVGDKSSNVVADTAKSFESIWNDKDSTYGVPVSLYDVQANKDFAFKNIRLASTGEFEGAKLARDANELQLVKSSLGEDSGAETVIPVARPLSKGNGIQGRAYELSYNWRVKTSTWDPRADEVRRALYDMIKREQAEIYIESAYVEYDKEMQELLLAALERGVNVTVVGNSLFVSNKGSKLISIARDAWTAKAIKTYGQGADGDWASYASQPRHLYLDRSGPGRFHFFVTTVYAGHMIHFKGAGFKCQKQESGQFNKSFLIGSHNFHVRSGLADKEHALIWDEPVDLTCITKMGTDRFTAKTVAEAEARYTKASVPGHGEVAATIQPRYRDLIEDRMTFYTTANHFYLKSNKPILYSFASLPDELNQEIAPEEAGKWSLNRILGNGYKWAARRIIYKEHTPGETPEVSPRGEKVFEFMSPFRDRMADFL